MKRSKKVENVRASMREYEKVLKNRSYPLLVATFTVCIAVSRPSPVAPRVQGGFAPLGYPGAPGGEGPDSCKEVKVAVGMG